MPKRIEAAASQASFFAIADPPPSLVDPDEPEASVWEILDPERMLARLHVAMQRRNHRDPIVTSDIHHEVDMYMNYLFKLWGIPTDTERREELRKSFSEAISFLQLLPFRDTTAMDYLMNNELTSQDIEELRRILASQYEVFADLESSEGFRRYGSEVARLRDQVSNPRTPRKFLRKR